MLVGGATIPSFGEEVFVSQLFFLVFLFVCFFSLWENCLSSFKCIESLQREGARANLEVWSWISGGTRAEV